MSDMPTWEGFTVPVLTVLSDGVTRTLRELRRDVADGAEWVQAVAVRMVSSLGQHLAQLMIGYSVGVEVKPLRRAVKLDRGFFT